MRAKIMFPKVWVKIIKMRIDEGEMIITKMLDKLRAQFQMRENVRLFSIKTMDLHAKFNLFYSLKHFLYFFF